MVCIHYGGNIHVLARQETPLQIVVMKIVSLIFALCARSILASPAVTPAVGAEISTQSRVYIVHQRDAYAGFKPDPEKILQMVKTGLEVVTGKSNPTSAWLSLLNTQDVVGIKILSAPGAISGTRPAVVRAVLETLIESGHPPSKIILWDRRLADLRRAGYFELAARYGVAVAGSLDEGYDEKAFYESSYLGKLVWGDVEFEKKGDGVGRKSYVSNLLTKKITKIVQITPLLNHNVTGVSGNLYSLALGSVDNILRFDGPERTAQAIPEIYALPQLSDHVVLNIVDALICQFQGEEEVLLHYSSILNELRFSTDPVALDVLSIVELQQQRSRNPAASPAKPIPALYNNATLLELGQSDLHHIEAIRLDQP